jgi:hypothetical protein
MVSERTLVSGEFRNPSHPRYVATLGLVRFEIALNRIPGQIRLLRVESRSVYSPALLPTTWERTEHVSA